MGRGGLKAHAGLCCLCVRIRHAHPRKEFQPEILRVVFRRKKTELTLSALIQKLQGRILRRLAAPSPAVVYHYTTQAGLLGILQTGTLWCGEVRYLNDAREFNVAYDLARQSLSDLGRDADSRDEREFLRRCARALLKFHDRFRCYVASFSEDGDMLSQWRAYAGVSGYAIGLRTAALRRSVRGLGDFGYWLPCMYDDARQRRHVRALIGDFLTQYRGLRRGNEYSKAAVLNHLPHLFPGRLILLGCCMKDKGFSEEREWRLVVFDSLFEGFPRPSPLQFRPGTRNLIPYIKYPLSKKKESLPLKSIVVGPSPHIVASDRSLRLFLQEKGLAKSADTMSAVPFQNW